jgi:hypothetical protein
MQRFTKVMLDAYVRGEVGEPVPQRLQGGMGGEDVRNGVDEAADVVLVDLQDQRLAGTRRAVAP